MKRRLFLVLLLASTLGYAGTVPRPAPEYAIKLTTGKEIPLSRYRGKAVALLFFYTTCPHCERTLRVLEGLHKQDLSKGFQAAVAFNPNADTLVEGFVGPAQIHVSGRLGHS